MPMRKVYRALSMAFAVTATHQQMLKESEFYPEHTSFQVPPRPDTKLSSPGTQKPGTAQETRRVIDGG